MDFGLSTPEHHHYLEVVLYNPGPEGSPVKESSEHLQLYVWFHYHSTYLSPLFAHPSFLLCSFVLDWLMVVGI